MMTQAEIRNEIIQKKIEREMLKIAKQKDIDRLPLHLKIKKERIKRNGNVDQDDIDREVMMIQKKAC
jgi:hypothetical protein|tara:strand:+ start:319 stop:519 length:201 start_codon:yes stop_codon:yes gene_type:complete